jgi:transmembrane serine protease 9
LIFFFICLNSVDGVGYAPAYHNKNFHGGIINPGFIVRVPSSFSPYPMLRQHLPFYNWQTYSYGHPSLIAPVDVASNRESGDPGRQLAVKQAIQCGRGPATMPKTRLGITDKIAGGTNTKKNVWPFVVS